MNELEEIKAAVDAIKPVIHKKRREKHQRFTFVLYDQDSFDFLEQFAQRHDTNMSSIITHVLRMTADMVKDVETPQQQKQIGEYIQDAPLLKPPRLDSTTAEVMDYLSTIPDLDTYVREVEPNMRRLLQLTDQKYKELAGIAPS